MITNQAAIEIVAVSANGVWVLWSSGYRALDGARLAPAFGTIVGRAAIGDVGGDGDTEIVVAGEHGVVLLNGDGLEGQVISTPLLTNSAPPSLGDLDGDGDLEITVPRTNGRLGLVHHSGLSYGAGWPFDTGTGLPLGVVVIANSMGGSSAPELHFSAQNGDVYVVDLAGTVVTGWPNGTAVGSEAV